jgi:hypothetical protein
VAEDRAKAEEALSAVREEEAAALEFAAAAAA